MSADEGLNEGERLAQGEQRRLPRVVLNRQGWASFCVRLPRYVC